MCSSDLAKARQRQQDTHVSVPLLLEAHVRDLAAMIREHEALTVAFSHALHEYAEKVAGPPRPNDESDPRNLAPVPDEIVRLITEGQEHGIFRSHPLAYEIGTLTVHHLLLRASRQPNEHPETTAEVALTALFGMLTPEVLVQAGPTGRPFSPSAWAERAIP